MGLDKEATKVVHRTAADEEARHQGFAAVSCLQTICSEKTPLLKLMVQHTDKEKLEQLRVEDNA